MRLTSFLAGCYVSMMCIKEDLRHFVYKRVVILKGEVESIDLKAFFIFVGFYINVY